jgi:hypothetical protein
MRIPENLDTEAFIAATRASLESAPKITVAPDGVPEARNDGAEPKAKKAAEFPADSRLIEFVTVLEKHGVDLQRVLALADELALSRKESRLGLAPASRVAEQKHQHDALVYMLQQSVLAQPEAQEAARLFVDRAEEVMG